MLPDIHRCMCSVNHKLINTTILGYLQLNLVTILRLFVTNLNHLSTPTYLGKQIPKLLLEISREEEHVHWSFHLGDKKLGRQNLKPTEGVSRLEIGCAAQIEGLAANRSFRKYLIEI